MKTKLFSPFGLLLAMFMVATGSLPTTVTPTAKNTFDTTLYAVSGKMEMTGTYCGGAAPSQHILDRLKQKKPLTGYQLYIRKGNINQPNAPIIADATTDENGTFTFHLPPGEYLLLSAEQLDKKSIRSWYENEDIVIKDPKCLEQWWQDGLTKITVKNRPVEDIYLHFRKQCSLPLGVPCLFYQGPKPR